MTSSPAPRLSTERLQSLSEDDLHSLCEATHAAILDGGGFGWLSPPPHDVLERYFRGLLLVPERQLFVARHDGMIVGAAQLVRPPRNNEAQAMSATMMHFYIAPYARGLGLGQMLLTEVEQCARAMGYQILNLDVRATQEGAVALFRAHGFYHWGTHPSYARANGQTVSGLFFTKRLQDDERIVPAHPQDTSTPIPAAGHAAVTGHSLTLYPAIDLKDGACVRLRRGEMDHATVYSDDPGAQARAWVHAGYRWLHVVDLNGAFAGRSANTEAIEAIIANATVPVQLGGGLRDLDSIGHWLSVGITRVILGSVAVKNPDLVREACRLFPGRIVAGIDARSGQVATEGWAETSEMKAVELGLRMQDAGVASVIFTEISRDGMLTGIDIAQTAELANTLDIPVIASGGVGSLEHLEALRAATAQAPGIEGVIVGRALYDGRVNPADALRVLA
ncbi:1-(5-phosphoribosyl)-5-[(5-phosphoribosylamino)methylideneamino]imidazole-4-carboxamide isomerase [Novacetimonas hansenii]|uniref:1-(5-phosphoribosyl)-5-[(5-phosphoribosylamino)methylideneamino] imidazole-4-carboxamide isomerase n=1 Tax=Novacetimonas hansenii TaxID=436 RepID=A0ABQ0SCL6_NOVHA|nr:1-(5-phosphoribosyl)-5-[(5-phosphoribosylamino)methylideneamino]imidazole-4-carboxamide isomerase [Novacetimonas hansenii]PYD73033.1 1-(5-phosphoribosyl)-5-[(5-phosphoribosylamino)methylideneamino]imidazole-4-carboxamide isomerase [Novacetimonas hansenii]QOF95904.1 1-(5-phosphoribosyl)-5-[(5-phosphoribosylamino)methylideneamino]imidazole-4-carboxamide isomerase [Novacetimonas hansenii]GAN83330.1 histidine biosynthesis isomerase HisA [Novacetimonas hansenii JCM 7643]GBQ56920.1 fusion protein 